MADTITPLKPVAPATVAPAANAPQETTPETSSYNFEIEQGLLGALMVNNIFYDHISDFLRPIHFYDPLHQKIYEVISSLINNNEPATAITLRSFFETDEQMKKRGGVHYLAALEGAASTLINTLAWARAIQNYAQRRELMKLGTEIHTRATTHDVENPPQQQIEQAESALYDIAEHGSYDEGLQNFEQTVSDAMETATHAHSLSLSGTTPGLSTGFSGVDEQLGTLRNSDLIVIAGRPAMGKTAFATNIAYNVARKFKQNNDKGDGKPKCIGFFSLEMAAEQLSMRVLAQSAQVPSYLIQQGKISDDELKHLQEKARAMHQLPLYIDHTGAISLPTLAARARRLKRQRGLGLIIVDYLQLITTGSRYRGNENRVQEVSQITQGLKALAKDLEVPVIALSQLSRQVESRDDKRPQLSDLRESGSIEQDADIVLFLFREEYYKSKEKPQNEESEEFMKWAEAMESLDGQAEVIVGKHRHGPTGTIGMSFDRQFMKFSDLAPLNMSTPSE